MRIPLRFDILTIFPNIFSSYLEESLIARARKKKLIRIHTHDLRKFTKNRHQKVDDAPFGGGPGMVVQIEPIFRAVQYATRDTPSSRAQAEGRRGTRKKRRIILFSTRGKKLDEKTAQRLSTYNQLILICGRYEGVDERAAEHIADEEISIGDYVLSGGELPALVLLEAVSRFLPGFLGKHGSLEGIKGSYPVYTRPASFTAKRGAQPWIVPGTLLQGNHAAIEAWRKKHGGRGRVRA